MISSLQLCRAVPDKAPLQRELINPCSVYHPLMSDTKARSSIGPGMGLIHLETGAQIIIPDQIEAERIVAATEALLGAVRDNIGEGIGCSDIAWMTATDVNAMLLVSIDMDEGPADAVAALHAAAEAFTERSGQVISQMKADAGE